MLAQGFWSPESSMFCEAQSGGYPEYSSAFSALVLSLMGFYGLFISMHFHCDIASYVYIGFVVNGIGSFGLHYTGTIGFGLVDMLSLVFIVSQLACLSFETCVYPVICTLPDPTRTSKRLYHLVKMGMRTLLFGTLVFIFILDTTNDRRDATRFLFVCAGIGYSGLLLSLYVTWHSHLQTDPNRQVLFRMTWISFLSMFLGAFSWFTELILCPAYRSYWRYIPTHALWHICATFSCSIAVQILVFYTSKCTHQNAAIRVFPVRSAVEPFQSIATWVSTFLYYTEYIEPTALKSDCPSVDTLENHEQQQI
jgi:hypothetical protein